MSARKIFSKFTKNLGTRFKKFRQAYPRWFHSITLPKRRVI
jgi:hypothetical protein